MCANAGHYALSLTLHENTGHPGSCGQEAVRGRLASSVGAASVASEGTSL